VYLQVHDKICFKPESIFTDSAEKIMIENKDLSKINQNGPIASPVIVEHDKNQHSEEQKLPETKVENPEIEIHERFNQDLHTGIKTENNENQESSNNEIVEKLKWAAINLGPVATAVMHGYAGINDLWFFKDFENNKIRKFVDGLALNFSKLVLTASCLINGGQAWKKNRLWEAMSRFIEPIFIVAEKRTEDLGLARGIGLGISQLVGSQEGIFNELVKQKYDIDLTDKDETRNPTKGQDHDMNTQALVKLGKEVIQGGLGKNRRFLTGLTFKNIKDKFGLFFKEFNIAAVKELISGPGDLARKYESFCDKSGVKHLQDLCKGDEKKDKGHTTALSGYVMILGSLLGYIGKESKNWAYKLGGTIRNMGGILADISIFGHKDPYFNASAIFLSGNTFMDIVQRFIPPTMKQVILPWSNISMAMYNIGVGLYLNRSDMKSNNQDKVQTYDTDLDTNKKVNIDPVIEPAKKVENTERSKAENLAMAA
jgi:hypothetical protein